MMIRVDNRIAHLQLCCVSIVEDSIVNAQIPIHIHSTLLRAILVLRVCIPVEVVVVVFASSLAENHSQPACKFK
jgi:hypothetical protein